MDIALWIVAGLLAALFAFAGVNKLLQGKRVVDKGMGWAEEFSDTGVRLIGLAEVLGALGLILPAVTGIVTWLVPAAAIGLAVAMFGATIVHVRRKEPFIVTIVLTVVALFVAVGRIWIAPFGA